MHSVAVLVLVMVAVAVTVGPVLVEVMVEAVMVEVEVAAVVEEVMVVEVNKARDGASADHFSTTMVPSMLSFRLIDCTGDPLP